MMRRFYWLVPIITAGTVAFAESPHLFLFEAAVDRARLTTQSEKARKALEEANFKRASRLISSGAVSKDEYDQTRTASTVATLDFQIAEIKLKQQEMALSLVKSLSRANRRIPVCRRLVKKKREGSSLLKKPKPKLAKLEEPQSGTQVKLDQPPPEPPTPDLSKSKPETIEPPTVVPPVNGPAPKDVDFPEVQTKPPPVKPKSKPEPAPQPGKKPGNIK